MSTTEECQASESPGDYWEMAPLWDWGKKGKNRQWDPASPGRPPVGAGLAPALLSDAALSDAALSGALLSGALLSGALLSDAAL